LRELLERDAAAGVRATPALAFTEATRWFMAGRRVDVSALAEAVGVSRVTMHRWVGTRDELLTEVMWQLASATLDRLLAEIDAEGIAPRGPELLGRFVGATVTNAGVQRLQREEPEAFLRLCTTRASTFHRRMVAKVAEVLEVDRRAGQLSVDLAAHELAFAAVRLMEAYAHAPSITGEPADPELAKRALRALIR